MKKILTISIIALLLAVPIVWELVPEPPRTVIGEYSMAYDIERRYTEDGSSSSMGWKTVDDHAFVISQMLYGGEDVTERIAPEELAEFLNGCMSRRNKKLMGARDLLWEIYIFYKRDYIRIFVKTADSGEPRCYWHDTVSNAYYEILDPDAMVDALGRMITPT